MAKKTAKKTTKKTTKKVRRDSAGGAAPADRPPRSAAAAQRDARTMAQLEKLASSVVKSVRAGREPTIGVPTRALSNTKWNKSKRILEMGSAEQDRQLFNLGQAKKFMQMMLHSSNIKKLLEEGKTTSLRGMYYTAKHTIPGTKEKTFDEQSESDAILEDLEVSLGSLREELHLFADVRGGLAGNITLIDAGDEINARRMGTGGYQIPSIVEPDVIEFRKCEADFVLHVEKGTVWRRFNEDRFWEKHNCIVTHGGGQPPRGVRRLLRRFHDELKLPIICLLDCDPWGHYIYSVIKQGSISLAFESQRLAIPDAKFIGIRASDYRDHELSDDVQIELSDRDITRARQIREYPWFKDDRAWQREIEAMLRNGFKMEVEALANKDISYVTEQYVPQKLADEDWLG